MTTFREEVWDTPNTNGLASLRLAQGDVASVSLDAFHIPSDTRLREAPHALLATHAPLIGLDEMSREGQGHTMAVHLPSFVKRQAISELSVFAAAHVQAVDCPSTKDAFRVMF